MSYHDTTSNEAAQTLLVEIDAVLAAAPARCLFSPRLAELRRHLARTIKANDPGLTAQFLSLYGAAIRGQMGSVQRDTMRSRVAA